MRLQAYGSDAQEDQPLEQALVQAGLGVEGSRVAELC